MIHDRCALDIEIQPQLTAFSFLLDCNPGLCLAGLQFQVTLAGVCDVVGATDGRDDSAGTRLFADTRPLPGIVDLRGVTCRTKTTEHCYTRVWKKMRTDTI